MPEDAVRIDILLDDERKAEKRLKSVERQSKRTFRSFEKDAKRGERSAKRFGGALKGIKGQVLAIAGGIGLASVVRTSVQNFMTQERAVLRVDAALEVMGNRLPKVRDELAAVAAEVQRFSIYGDEAVLKGQALALSMGATVKQTKDMSFAAADLATALDVDLETAFRQMAVTLGGMSGELGEKLPAIRNLTQQERMAGGAISLIRNRFGGMASRVADSESGQFIQMLNAFGDRLEPVGGKILEGLNFLADIFEAAGKALADKESFVGKSFRTGALGMGVKYLEDRVARQNAGIARAVEMPPEVAAALKRVADEEKRRQDVFDMVNSSLRESGLAMFSDSIGTKESGLAMFSDSIGTKALDLMKAQFERVTPKQVAQILEQGRTTGERFEADMAFLANIRSLVGYRDDYAGMRGEERSGAEAGVERLMRERQLANIYDTKPIATNFANELGASVQFSLADGINAGFRTGGRGAIEAFTTSLGNSVLNAVSDALAAALVEEAGLKALIDDGLLSLLGNASAGAE